VTAPEPRANPELVGHEAAELALLEAASSGRLHHAWLIVGPAGVGKATLAYRFARRLLAGLPPTGEGLALDPNHPVFRRVAAGSHADLHAIERSADTRTGRLHREILVDDVRAGAEFLRLTAAEGGWRVVVVDPTEALNANAANALLKLLEEPPARAVLLLVCSAPGRLPATLRSRCRLLRLAPLGTAEMQKVLARALPDLPVEERARLIALGEGSPGRALRLAADEGIAIAALVEEVLATVPGYGTARAHGLVDRLGRGESGFATFMELLLSAIAAAVRAGARGHADPGQQRLLAFRPLDAWGEVWHALSGLADETERLNLDRRQALILGLALLDGA
jgi:DNA polymerase-3 subunit delta'